MDGSSDSSSASAAAVESVLNGLGHTTASRSGEMLSDLLTSLDRSSKTVLVTGGAGFIGSHVADLLMARGDNVIICDEMNDYYDTRLKRANLELLYSKYGERCVFYQGDICEKDFITNLFEREKPTHICHLAARAGVRASIEDPYIYVHSNIEGTTRLLDLARLHSCHNFVYASSSSVYGNCDKVRLLVILTMTIMTNAAARRRLV